MSVDALMSLLERRHGLRIDDLTVARLLRVLTADAGPGGDTDVLAARVVCSPPLVQQVLDRVTLQETSFFRDTPVFDALASDVLPAAIRAAAGGPLTVWSAGCANGQEAWSVAMLLSELGAPRFEVVASDLSATAVARAERGVYAERELRGLDEGRRARYLIRSGSDWEIGPALRRHVRVVEHNAAMQPAPVPDAGCALVLCRYVLIYLTVEAADTLLGRVADALTPDGRLVIGAAESLWHLSERFAAEPLPHAVAYRARRPDDGAGAGEAGRRLHAPRPQTPTRGHAGGIRSDGRPSGLCCGASSPSPGARPLPRPGRGRSDPPGRGGRGRGRPHRGGRGVPRRGLPRPRRRGGADPARLDARGARRPRSGESLPRGVGRGGAAPGRAARGGPRRVRRRLAGRAPGRQARGAAMNALVCFRAGAGQRYALDVAHAGSVVPLGALDPLPEPLPAVLGLLRVGDELLPVLGSLGATGEHVLVVRAAAERFGLLVGAVSGVVRVDDEELGPPPAGQQRDVVRAVAGGPGEGALVLDPDLLARALER